MARPLSALRQVATPATHRSCAFVTNPQHVRRRVTGAADVGQQAGQRPAQRDDSQSFGVLQRGVGNAPGRLDFPGAAQRRGQDDVRFHGVTRRTERRGQLYGALGVAHGRRPSPRAIASSADTHASRTGSRGGTDPVSSSPARRNAVADAANRPTPSASAASPMRASAPASGSAPAMRHRPAVPPAGPVVPAELTQERRPGAVRQRRQRIVARAAGTGQVGHCAAVAALTAGGHGAQPQFVRRRRRRQRPASRVVTEGGVRQHDVHRIATLSMRRAKPGTGGHAFDKSPNRHWLTVCGGHVNSTSTAFWEREIFCAAQREANSENTSRDRPSGVSLPPMSLPAGRNDERDVNSPPAVMSMSTCSGY